MTVNRICGHRDGDATSCPGDALYAQLAELRTRASALAGPVAAPQGQVTLAVAAAAVPYGQRGGASPGSSRAPAASRPAGVPVALQKRGRKGLGDGRARHRRGRRLVVGRGAVAAHRARSARGRAAPSSPVAKVDVVASVRLRTPRRRRVRGRHRGPALRPGPAGGARPRPRRVQGPRRRRGGACGALRPASCGGRTSTRRSRLRRPGLYRLTARTAGPGAHVRDAPLLIRVVRGR